MKTLLALLPVSLALASENLSKLDVWRAGEENYSVYRIPGLVVTGRGTVIAYAEARKSTRGDWGTIDIVMKRSKDRGRTWSPQTVVANVPGSKTKNPVALAQGLASSAEVTYNNPVAIPGKRAGVVHLIYCLEYMRAFYSRSNDDGATFSAPREITSAFESFRKDYDWKVLATGPGHGIRLRNGRLVIPVWLSTGTGGHAHRPSVASTIFSDDDGGTWKGGEIAFPNTDTFINPSETAAVELPDGRVMLNARSESQANRRLVSISMNGATGWSEPVFQDDLVEPICMASIVSHPSGALLFSNPANLERADGKEQAGKPRDRKNLTVRVSRDAGKTWPVRKSIEPGYSGYSDLAVLADGTILLLYERAAEGARQFAPDALTLAAFDLKWITQ